MSETCLINLLEDAKGRLTSAEAKSLLQKLMQQAKAKAQSRNMNIDDALDASAKEIVDQEKELLQQRKREILINIKVKNKINDFINEFKDPVLGWRAFIGGIQSNIKRNRKSLDNERRVQGAKFFNYMQTQLKKENLQHIVNDKSLEEELTLEMWQEGNSKNKDVIKAASIIRDTYEKMKKTANHYGAKIGTIQNYVARQTHDIEKLSHVSDNFNERMSERLYALRNFSNKADRQRYLRDKAFQRWKDFILPRLNSELTFEGADPEKFLRGAYDGLMSGIHLKPRGETSQKLKSFTGFSNKAKKMSAERVLHFKDGKSWFEYNKTFGSGSLQNSILSMMRGGGRDIALLKRLGTNPKSMFERVNQELLENHRTDPKIKSRLQSIKYIYDEIDGTTSVPVNHLGAKIGASIRAVQSMAKLGGVVLSSISDIAIKASQLREYGVGAFDAYATSIADMFGGKPKGEYESVADELGVWADGQAGYMHAYHSAADSMPGFMTKTMQTYFKFTGMEWWDHVNRTSFGLFISRHLAKQKHIEFEALAPNQQKLLRMYDIDKKEWDLIRNHQMKMANGKEFLTPNVIDNFSDESIANYLGKSVDELKASDIKDVEEEIHDNLMNYFIDQTDHVNIRQEAADRSLILGGTQPGTLHGEIWRFIGQFKYFSIGYIRRALGRLVYGHGAENLYDAFINGKGDISGIAQLIVGSTLLGYISTSAKQMAVGLNPRDPSDLRTWQAALLQGGGLSIYGDFLFGEYNRYGQGLMTSILGPTAGAADALASIFSQLREGQDPANATFRFLKTNTPFINMFYTKMALDYLILYNIQDRISPGSVERLQHNIEKQNHQTYWLPPTKALGVNQ